MQKIINKKIFLYSLWLIVTSSFIFGVILPIATIKKFFILKNSFSLAGSLKELAINPSMQNTTLFIIIFVFTIVFPVAKLITMFLQIKNKGENWQNKMTKLVETIGHFSMLDVFILALMVLLLKIRVLVNVNIHFGFYIFSFSIILSIILSAIIKHNRNSQQLKK